jgi:hypothetical protein
MSNSNNIKVGSACHFFPLCRDRLLALGLQLTVLPPGRVPVSWSFTDQVSCDKLMMGVSSPLCNRLTTS